MLKLFDNILLNTSSKVHEEFDDAMFDKAALDYHFYNQIPDQKVIPVTTKPDHHSSRVINPSN